VTPYEQDRIAFDFQLASKQYQEILNTPMISSDAITPVRNRFIASRQKFFETFGPGTSTNSLDGITNRLNRLFAVVEDILIKLVDENYVISHDAKKDISEYDNLLFGLRDI
jgi:hypothetical protein